MTPITDAKVGRSVRKFPGRRRTLQADGVLDDRTVERSKSPKARDIGAISTTVIVNRERGDGCRGQLGVASSHNGLCTYSNIPDFTLAGVTLVAGRTAVREKITQGGDRQAPGTALRRRC